jgi:thiosulfate/3-mercaptopyruvate sulfurtransferase
LKYFEKGEFKKKEKTKYIANFNSKLIKNFDQIMSNIDKKEYKLIDARSKGRFEGIDPEPRKAIKSGKNFFY